MVQLLQEYAAPSASHEISRIARRQDLSESLVGSLQSETWGAPAVHSECSLHQLAPYIGKLKSSIAADLVRTFSRPGQLVVDPFCGAGTVALEAALAGRHVFASDVSPYAQILTRAKTAPPPTLEAALGQVEELLGDCQRMPSPDLRRVPRWVRSYFHPATLKEVISFSEVCRDRGHAFAYACLLGILHHQRPGFLSYPSSHLVPYLRDKKFPREEFPSLYEYRPLRPRLLAKVTRAYKRVTRSGRVRADIRAAAIDDVILPPRVNAVITSPPYMNALDYGRDNRLRLWFVDPDAPLLIDESTPSTMVEFVRLMKVLATKVLSSLAWDGYCALVIGDVVSRSAVGHPARAAIEVFSSTSEAYRTVATVEDDIPDIRRARRDYRGVKREYVVVFQKTR